MEKATQQHIKEQNRNLALKMIFERPSTSRAEIARLTHLTRTTVSDIVSGLIDEGLVREIGTGSSIGGKAPTLLSLVDDSRHIISLDLAYNRFCGAIVNLRGQIREMVSQPIDSNDGAKALEVVYQLIDELIQKSSQDLIGISAATPGLVSAKEGIVINSVNMSWQDLPLGALLQERYHLPVKVLNDCQAAALGEFEYGDSSPSNDNRIVIRAGHGIGVGIIINGQIFTGDEGFSGEIGHVTYVYENGLPCRCGNLGCLETVASAQSVVQRARSLAHGPQPTQLSECPEINLDVLENVFYMGDPVARAIIIDAGHYLGKAVANLAGGFNINKIVLTGLMTRFGPTWFEAVQETARQCILPRTAQTISIEFGHLKDNEAVLGASASLASNYSLLFKQ